jgi:hypothetical protein
MGKLIFGWVSDQIQSNYANWSSWKSTGNSDDANKFYQDTWEKANSEGLTWFCYPVED